MSKEKQVVLSEAERKEKRLHIIYKILPVVSVVLLIVLWIGVSGGENSAFPSPADVYQRLLKFMAKPIQKLSLWQPSGPSPMPPHVAAVLVAAGRGTRTGGARTWRSGSSGGSRPGR